MSEYLTRLNGLLLGELLFGVFRFIKVVLSNGLVRGAAGSYTILSAYLAFLDLLSYFGELHLVERAVRVIGWGLLLEKADLLTLAEGSLLAQLVY